MVRQVTVIFGVATVLLVKAPTVGERALPPERRALGALFAVQQAQAAHHAITGYYNTVQCLGSPVCLKPLGLSAPRSLLDPDIGALKDQGGYRLHFFLGPRSATPALTSSGLALSGFAIVAVPRQMSKDTPRALCSDATGGIYATPGERLPPVEDGRCIDRSQVVHTPSGTR